MDFSNKFASLLFVFSLPRGVDPSSYLPEREPLVEAGAHRGAKLALKERNNKEDVRPKTPQVGFEPTTNRLTADRSTTELLRNISKV